MRSEVTVTEDHVEVEPSEMMDTNCKDCDDVINDDESVISTPEIVC